MTQMLISNWHRVVLGTDPNQEQSKLYQQPNYRGFSDRERDQGKAEASILLALSLGGLEARPVIFTPPAMEEWVLGEIGRVADLAFAGCKQYPDPVAMVKGYTQLFKRLLLTTKPFQLADEPSHWVSIGFSQEDQVPGWLSQRLLP